MTNLNTSHGTRQHDASHAHAGRVGPDASAAYNNQEGWMGVYHLLADGPDLVRRLTSSPHEHDRHTALAHARYLQQLGHPDGAQLVAEARAALKGGEA